MAVVSGDIDLHVNAKHDVTFKINATSGDILIS